MPFIFDTPALQPPLNSTPTLAAAAAAAAAASAPAQELDTRSTRANCSCTIASNGQVQHTCTAASYTPQPVVRPPHDPAGRAYDLGFLGSQF